jgi:S-DNA-T family DNA segregation ATPase FtsK/SpoIIIE
MRALAWLIRHPLFTLVPAVVILGAARYGLISVGWTCAGLAAGLTVWWRAHPASFDRGPGPLLRSARRRWFAYAGRRWAAILGDCELTREHRTTGQTVIPRVMRVRSTTPSIDTLHVRMVRGQDMRIWTDQAEALAHALGAERVAVVRHRPSVVSLVVERTMPFTTVLPAPDIPASSAEVDLRALDIGDDEYGQPMTLSVIGGSHPLIAGASGAGKGSAMWGTLRALGPMIGDGSVRVRMIDLKGGTETELGAPLFHRRAIDMDAAVALLREARDGMKADQERQRQSGARRDEPSQATPLDLIVIDEMAMLTAYGDRTQVREALRLLAEIMTQGRSTLWTVAGFIQEPSKDILDIRELFTTRICLGVTAASHVDMVLGDGARERGALADEIPLDEDHAGIGFRIDKGSRLPRRLRLGYSTDRDITELVTRCTPGPHLAAVPALLDDQQTGADEGVA